MYSTDSHVLRQVCKLINQITKRYQLSDEDIFKIAESTIVLMKLVKQIESKDNE